MLKPCFEFRGFDHRPPFFCCIAWIRARKWRPKPGKKVMHGGQNMEILFLLSILGGGAGMGGEGIITHFGL